MFGRKKVHPGDGSPLPRPRFRELLWRTTMLGELGDPDGRAHEYAVRVDLMADERGAHLYRDGVQVGVSDLPARFEVPGGRVEVAVSVFGIKRARVVAEDGTERGMRPARGTAEHARARFDRRFPTASRLIGALAVVVCLVGLVTFGVAAAELVTSWEVVAERVGTFESPLELPGWFTIGAFVAGLVAGTERALSLRNHWLIDADTWVLGP
ncbi:hypothetical protein RDV89_03010 [Nocardioides zeae]|uniref:PEGA domain-containing protein n=1 Tax=Nocardioides imazamoxiresistens TaxID=3231893 RepID=A0ABU3PTA3_9ACTN|nr:hypothetical protein [Nocardioides zeae]MDT9592020.1 hypothetical protein [Nocardioides zeae]